MPTQRTVIVPAIADFEWEGREVHAGESVSMPPVYALAYARKRLVSLSRNTYQTRHLEAAPVAADPEPEPEAPRRRRGRPRTRPAEDV